MGVRKDPKDYKESTSPSFPPCCPTDASSHGNWCSDVSVLVLFSQVDTIAKETAIKPNEALLSDLRALEKKMGLVLTLVRRFVVVCAVLLSRDSHSTTHRLTLLSLHSSKLPSGHSSPILRQKKNVSEWNKNKNRGWLWKGNNRC